MIDLHKKLVDVLKTVGLPVHYEMNLTSGLKVPCISYMELGNQVAERTDITDICYIQYQIKVWGTQLKDIQLYSQQIDKALRKEFFKRIGSAELYDNNSNMIQKVMTYEVLTSETF